MQVQINDIIISVCNKNSKTVECLDYLWRGNIPPKGEPHGWQGLNSPVNIHNAIPAKSLHNHDIVSVHFNHFY